MSLKKTSTEVDEFTVISICNNQWNQNCFVLMHAPSHQCVIVDPGYGMEDIIGEIDGNGLSIQAILGTHSHFDHIASVKPLQEKYGNPAFWIHPNDVGTLNRANLYTMALKSERVTVPGSFELLQEGQTIPFVTSGIKVLHTPGHTPGGCVFSFQDTLFSGDLLILHHNKFLPGFNESELNASKERLFMSYPPETVVFPGHGRVNTLGGLGAK